MPNIWKIDLLLNNITDEINGDYTRCILIILCMSIGQIVSRLLQIHGKNLFLKKPRKNILFIWIIKDVVQR